MKRHLRGDEIRMHAAGLTDEDGVLGRPRTLPPLRVPKEIRLAESGAWLRWLEDGDWESLMFEEGMISRTHHRQDVPPDLLNRFTDLGDAPRRRIAQFAEQFGPLYLCGRHGEPHTHASAVDQGGGLRSLCPVAAVPGREGWLQEPVEGWRRLARGTRGILEAAVKLLGPHRVYDDTWVERMAEMQSVLNWWLTMGEVRPVFAIGGGSRGTTLEPSGLLGTLALQLADTVSKTAGLAECSGCGSLYRPERRPSQGRRRYCRDCRRRKVPQRDAQRDLVRKKRAAQAPP